MLTRDQVKDRLRNLITGEGIEEVRLVVDTYAQYTIRMTVERLLRSATLQEVQDILDEIVEEAN